MDDLQKKREALATYTQWLLLRDQSFAESLLQYFDKNKSWSAKQLYWVDTLIQRGKDLEPKSEQKLLDFPPPPIPEAVQNLIRITQLFQKARDQGLKYPKIRLEADDGTKVVLRYSKPNYPPDSDAQINITNNLPYNQGREFYGRIKMNGHFLQGRQATPAILKLINDLSKDPVGLAKLYGLKTSTCCFCSRPLETSESVTMGYGPICAVKFGLPWGETVTSSYTCLTLEKESA
jgi:Family of unknown function (DUF6011)